MGKRISPSIAVEMKSPLALAIALAVLLLVVDSEAEQINGRKVVVHTGRLNWFKASESCRRRGMQLLTINSAMENLEVVELGKEYGLEWVWTAATDLAQRRQWVWSTSGQEVQCGYWKDGEPSNKKENCIEAQMEGYPSNWNDNECKRARPFICEEIPDFAESFDDDSDDETSEDDDDDDEGEKDTVVWNKEDDW